MPTNRLPDAIRQQLRGILAVLLYSKVMHKDKMKIESQIAIMNDLFLGENGKRSTAKALGLALQEFSEIFDVDGPVKTLKQEFYVYKRAQGSVEVGRHITPDVVRKVEFDGGKDLDPKTLYNLAKKCFREMKKSIPLLY